MNLFEAVEGQRSENLATQALLVILESPAFRELQRLFYQLLMKDGVLLCTESRQFRVSTQESDQRLGRPDLKIEGEDALILLENKFTALFSPNQLPRYAELLGQSTKPTKVLVLVCPQHKRTGYELDAVRQFGATGVQVESFAELQARLTSEGIRLLVVTWEELLRVMDSDHFVVTELASFIRERFLVHIEFTPAEVRRVMSTEIPEMLLKLFKLVSRIKGEIEGNGIEVGRSSQSVRYWAFNLFKNDTAFYFGYMLDPWMEYETPLFLQCSPTWELNTRLTEEMLIQVGFTKVADDNFLLPIRLEEGDENAVLLAVVGQLQQAIDRVVALLPAPVVTAATPPT